MQCEIGTQVLAGLQRGDVGIDGKSTHEIDSFLEFKGTRTVSGIFPVTRYGTRPLGHAPGLTAAYRAGGEVYEVSPEIETALISELFGTA